MDCRYKIGNDGGKGHRKAPHFAATHIDPPAPYAHTPPMPLKHEKPNPRLMAELLEVRSAAEELKNLVKTTQGLPNLFPLGPLENMLLSLIGLPDGTAADARPILHAADKRGVKLRYEYSKHRREGEQDRNPDYIPPFERGQKLDTRLSRLRTALGTALEECRVQEIGDHPDEDFDPWGYDEVDNDPDVEGLEGQDRRDLLARSNDLNMAISDTSGAAQDILNTETESSDIFLRHLTGLQNLNLITTAEASFVKGKSRINNTLQSALALKPLLLNTAADAIERGLDFAEPHHKTWKEFKKDKIGFVLKKSRQVIIYLRQHAEQLAPPPEVAPGVQEAAEQEAVALLRENKPVPLSIGENVRNLEINSAFKDEGKGFHNTTLLQTCPWLQSLALSSTQVTDLSPLAALSHLRSLKLYGTQVSNSTYLAELTNLQKLNLGGTQVSDITHLANLTNLQSLYLHDTQVVDITHLANLTNLQSLVLGGTRISDISNLINLTNLQLLILVETQISDITHLAKLTNLQSLHLNNTQVSDITHLANLTNLQSLHLNNTQVSDISPLAILTNLKALDLSNTQITNWSPVAHVKTVVGRPDDWDS